MSCCAAGTEGALDIERAGHALPTAEELRLASRDLGEGLLQTDLSVPAVHCGTCISTIERALRARPEVERARVNLSTKRVSVVWKDKIGDVETDPVEFARAIAATGYESHLFTAAEEAADSLRNQLIRAVAVSGFAATNIMLLSVSIWSGADASTRDMFHWISAMIAAPALIYAGRFFYQSAWNALKHGRSNMDVPIAIGISLSYFISLWETIHHGEHAYFDATASLLFFLLIGRTLDHVMRDRARSAISGLARLSPRGAMVVGADGSREYRPLDDVRVGDHVAVTAGDRIPVDGLIVTGASDMDVSIINGESAPQQVAVGDAVQAGTLSLTGSLVIEATATARNSFLAEVINLMEAAEGGRARYRRIADRAAQFYAPAVHLTALLTFFGWGFYDGDWKHALLVAVAVLIITCPCALGLAVPVVQVVAAGRLFKAGIMVKDGSAMERLAEIDSVAFDKTGTLTLGRPRLVDAAVIDVKAFAIAAGLARHSRHPLSQALWRAVGVAPRMIDAVREIPGAGIEAETAEGVYRLGSRKFACADASIDTGDHAYSEVVLSLDGRELQSFRFEDTLRPGAEKAIALLKGEGFSVGILSGDRAGVVAALAQRLGIANWKAELAPRDKAEFCAAVEAEGHKLLMVGDGINDAPALAAAHVSIAPATAADVGRQAADFVFMRQNLDSVAFAIEASRRAGRLIRENFALAIGYNVIAVPIAILGYATPLIAAVAMSTSSIIVVVNALRLNRLSLKDDAGSGQPVAPARFVAPDARLAS
ncbi:MAG: cadmium-translocating P-type ATPase [Alphaproteobacteria bacterium]|nr:cadmium-translocating P-type ATPase [Rhizobiaceae bacterium]MBU3959396.1 cadmium-translocating P-type ATPase [Alphaproteobacteria bacterium]MBU4049463.1 cadmium-translocating P-type ATPase [Alphaproteobacteria bacterium]MBU4089739.1 cadmium-translocating P-type ATPase [Alphaproteobacteria bacterium]MBU4154770.1 cadmium-translocating P-type ATPase [Alphaproteobacteria bacterium]